MNCGMKKHASVAVAAFAALACGGHEANGGGTITEPLPVNRSTGDFAPAANAPRASGASTPRDVHDAYTLSDLRALESTKAWRELVEHLGDIAPAARDANWQALAEHGSTELLETLAIDQEPLHAAAVADELTKRFPTLTTSRSFMRKRAELGLRGFTACFQQSRSGVACTERLLGFVRSDPENHELAMDAGRLVSQRQFAYAAVPFFRVAVVGNADNGAMCDDEALKSATAAALTNLPGAHPLCADARKVLFACRKGR